MPPARELPIIDIGPLLRGDAERDRVVGELDRACREHGFFLIQNHGVPTELRARLDRAAREFFALPSAEKAAIGMARGGSAWRGWFPPGGELTSGAPDQKEGLYFGRELPETHPKVAARTPMHGRNLFPARPAALRRAVLEWIEAVTALGRRLLAGLALALGLGARGFDELLGVEPVVLFRVFHYPPVPEGTPGWGVGEHTDYGLLTLLAQDSAGGLEVHTPAGWLQAPPIPDTFVCNLGDMLERMTGGRYRSTPHRVTLQHGTPGAEGLGRLSFPLFLDPAWDSELRPLAPQQPRSDRADAPARPRWDRADPAAFTGTYGDYLLAKVARVFPELFQETVSLER